MNTELQDYFREKSENYAAGRAMALSFKPLTIDDIKEAYMQGVEEMLIYRLTEIDKMALNTPF